VSQPISITVLQRVIVLLFPLLFVCFFGLDVARNKRDSTPKDAGLGLKKVGSAESSVAWQSGGKGSDNVSPMSSINQSDHSRLSYQKLTNTAVLEASFHSRYPDLLSQLCEKERRQLEAYFVHLGSVTRMDQPWLCWDEGVQRAKLELYHEVEKFTGLSGGAYEVLANQFQSEGRWSKTATDGFAFSAQGDSSIITWSIVPDNTTLPGLMNQSAVGSNFRSWMASLYGGSISEAAADQPWFDVFEGAFEEMAATCGLTLVYEPIDDGIEVNSSNPGELGIRGDIRIAARGLDGNSGNLAIAFPPDHGDMIFDSSDGIFQITSGSSIRLFNTITHELGHSLGLAHVCPINRTKLLEPSLTTSFRGPQFDEFQSLQRLYGDRFELHGDFRNNDTVRAAKPIELIEGSRIEFLRLSIDDDRDQDFYRFEGLIGQRLNVEVVPGEGAYLEGGETDAGCSEGTRFESGKVHDLSLQIFAEDGETILFDAASGGLGDSEKIEQFRLPATGYFYLRVSGDQANAAQIYELEMELMARVPAPWLKLVGHKIIEESGTIKNGRLDPGETIRLAIEVENSGELETGPLATNISVSDNGVLFNQSTAPQLEPGEMGVIEVVVGTTGSCGEFLMINLKIEGEAGELLKENLEFEAGVLTRPVAFNVDFENLKGLPVDWKSKTFGSGEEWEVVSSRWDSPIQSAFVPGRDSAGEAFLLSPVFELASGGGDLSFSHLYRLEAGFDGAVLEVSRNGGEWVDLLIDPSVITKGGYNRSIREGFGSAIMGQQAWSGILEVFMPVSVKLPVAWAGEMLQFRWRVVHDASSARDGWWIDDVKMEMLTEDCEPHRPEVTLALKIGELDENYPDSSAILALETNLPLASSLSIPLELLGSATFLEDYLINPQVFLPAAKVSLEIPVRVIPDSIIEGAETALIQIPSGDPAFVGGRNFSVPLMISDLLSVDTWSALFLGGEVNLLADSDGDGFNELSEYVLGTDPSLAKDRPTFELIARDEGFIWPFGLLPNRPDATLKIEGSSDLENWEVVEVIRVAEGFEIIPRTQKSYFRLKFSLN
jgi:hypothetical protein